MISQLIDTCFFETLLEADRELAGRARAAGCPYCGGRLDVSNYGRKPRGLAIEWEGYCCKRLSFCCRLCRRRVTPVSVRFLGRKVYWALVLISEKFRSFLNISKKTLRRWKVFWGTIFSLKHVFMKIVRGLLPSIEKACCPEFVVSHYEDLTHNYEKAVFKSLQFFSPLSTKTDSNYLGIDYYPQKMARDAIYP